MQTRLLILIGSFGIALGAGPVHANIAEFLHKAIQGDNSETTLGALAQRRGHSAGVRQFGTMLVRDHQQARRKAVPVERFRA